MANPSILEVKKANLTKKIADLKSGKIKCELKPGDGRQEEAIATAEYHLRSVNKAILDAAGSDTAKTPKSK